MEWTQNVSLGQWIAERTSGRLSGRVDDLIPRGFDAYARIFHPMPTWSGEDDAAAEQTTWVETAADFGTTMDPLAQSTTLRRMTDPWSSQSVVAPSNKTYGVPEQGTLPNLPQVAGLLRNHTTTPNSCVAAIWEGWGGLASGGGRGFLVIIPSEPTLLGRTVARVANRALRFGDWARGLLHSRRSHRLGTGILPADVATGPRFEMPDRNYYLARLSLDELTADDWEQRVLWADPPFVHTPSLLWPDDRAWALATEIDFDTTLVGGSHALIQALTSSRGIEALEVPGDADLGFPWSHPRAMDLP
ncbi:MAG: hypothetical protein LBV00_10625 [Propionibacteriaceae bacterium]|jgi:hypothetical protein|nr:hypothetical protein [Propionibacteriaceae bacterium]